MILYELVAINVRPIDSVIYNSNNRIVYVSYIYYVTVQIGMQINSCHLPCFHLAIYVMIYKILHLHRLDTHGYLQERPERV